MPAKWADDQVAKDLCEKLKNAGLTDPERELLAAALKIAVDVIRPERSLDAEFNGCFKDGDAGVIEAYHQATAGKSDVGSGISKTFATDGISNAPTFATITKSTR